MVCSALQKIGIRESWLTEFVSMMLFVYIGCGTAAVTKRGTTQGDWYVTIALAFGIGIAVLAYATAHRSGGHINCAVTIALMISQDCEVVDGIGIIFFQLLGSICGAGLLAATVPEALDTTTNLGCNAVATGYSVGNAFVGETFMTFLLMYTVYETAVSTRPVTRTKPNSDHQPVMAPLAIGLSVFLAHIVLLNITGCSINPTRSFGPAVVASAMGASGVWTDFWVFVVAPIFGASIAAVCKVVDAKFSVESSEKPVDKVGKRSAENSPLSINSINGVIEEKENQENLTELV